MNRKTQGTWFDDPAHFCRPTRREFLYVGLVGGLGLTLPQFLRSQARAAATEYALREGVAKSVIHIFLPGGIAHQDSFDPKPYAPLEYRGPYNSIETALPGVRFSELFPETAAIADRIAICRSMTHGEAAHERGTHNMFTGYRPSPALDYPSMGSVVSHELGPRNNLPPYVCVPNMPTTYAGSGYLSSAYGPFSIGSDPASKDFAVRDLSLPEGIDADRFAKRRSLLETVDSHFRSLEQSDALDAMDSFYQRAYSLISSQEAREAFDMAAEPDEVRDRYGRNAAGQRMLLARRLVEAGVRFVSLTYGSWDHHDKIKEGFSNQAPPLDKAYAALIRDLEQRGILDSTLVMLTTEFGRTPKLNNTDGRDHWPRVFSVLLAGGGIRKGLVYGSSDALAGEPENDPLTVENLATTIYNQMGIPAEKELISPGDRPIEIVKGGRVVQEMLA